MRKIELLRRLRNLRREIETGQGALSESQLYLLTDVCQCLGFADAETHYVVGDMFTAAVTMPIPYHYNDLSNAGYHARGRRNLDATGGMESITRRK